MLWFLYIAWWTDLVGLVPAPGLKHGCCRY